MKFNRVCFPHPLLSRPALLLIDQPERREKKKKRVNDVWVLMINTMTVTPLDQVRFLDLEGENGGKPPKTAIGQRLEELLNSMGAVEYQSRRRRAVAESLSRLAFVVSDVMIYVWNESFANASYMMRVRQLAEESTQVLSLSLSRISFSFCFDPFLPLTTISGRRQCFEPVSHPRLQQVLSRRAIRCRPMHRRVFQQPRECSHPTPLQ